jgi:hypothetical protein
LVRLVSVSSGCVEEKRVYKPPKSKIGQIQNRG